MNEAKIIKEMGDYVAKLKKQQIESHDTAVAEAIDALYRTGVTDESGKTKKQIVSLVNYVLGFI